MTFLIILSAISFFMMLGGSIEGTAIFICSIVVFIIIAINNERVNNYDMNKVDENKIWKDNGKSKYEIGRNLINGKYDK